MKKAKSPLAGLYDHMVIYAKFKVYHESEHKKLAYASEHGVWEREKNKRTVRTIYMIARRHLWLQYER